MTLSAALLAACGASSSAPEPADREAEPLTSAGASAEPIVGLGGKCLDDYGDGTGNGNEVDLYTCNGTAAQKWTYTGGTLRGPGEKCLDVSGDVQASKTRVQLYACNGTKAQQWTFMSGQLRSAGGFCLNVTNASVADGTPLELYECVSGQASEVWTQAGSPAPADAGSPPPADGGSAGTGGHVPVPIDASYVLTFDDEFNGSSLNTSRWNVLAGNIEGEGESLAANVSIGSGDLHLATTKATTPSGKSYGGSFIYQKGFSQSFGYFESRFRVSQSPAGASHGLWQAFWMNAQGSYPEIDMPEWLGRQPTTAHMTYHPAVDSTGIGVTSGSACTGTDFSAAFHVMGVLWTAQAVSFYVDGVQCFQVTQQTNIGKAAITSTPMTVNLNASVGGWGGINTPDSTTEFPAVFDVDYVHVYSNAKAAVSVTPDPGYGGPGDTGAP